MQNIENQKIWRNIYVKILYKSSQHSKSSYQRWKSRKKRCIVEISLNSVSGHVIITNRDLTVRVLGYFPTYTRQICVRWYDRIVDNNRYSNNLPYSNFWFYSNCNIISQYFNETASYRLHTIYLICQVVRVFCQRPTQKGRTDRNIFKLYFSVPTQNPDSTINIYSLLFDDFKQNVSKNLYA